MSQGKFLRVVGMDPSLRNWGLAIADYFPDTGKIDVLQVQVIQPALPTGKQVRQNSLDLESAKQLYLGARAAALGAQAIFVEVPHGSQSSRAMASYGLCCGVLGSMQASNISFFQVTPDEVKIAATGKKTASKVEMINWATRSHPKANWPYHNQVISAAKAEHMADACGAIHAGVKLQAFQQLLQLQAA